MKSILKKAIHGLGYDLVRRNGHSGVRGNFWSDWFRHFPGDLTESYVINRNNLKRVSAWLDAEVHANSFWGYGVPARYLDASNKNSLNHNPAEFTYSDLMVAIGRKLGAVKTLEIGVSAGKNFFQMFTGLENSTLYGMDIEEINPILENTLSKRKLIWESESAHDFTDRNGEVVKKTFSLHHYENTENRNTICYLSGDKFNASLWDKLNGMKFNIIFSDAFHKPESILDEFKVLKSRELFDDKNFVMVWDDLEGVEMQNAFLKICAELSAGTFARKQTMQRLYELHGTYSGLHKIGVFCSFEHQGLRKYFN